jgi:RNA:NAD 2'-phosphotransferase (TPT1/KptA family)
VASAVTSPESHPKSLCISAGPRASSQVFIFVDVQRAIDAGIKFFLSDNGVVLTAGDERGFLAPQFFERVEGSKRVTISPADGNSLVDALDVVELK